MVYGDDWRLRKINFEGLIKIENDRDIWNLKNEDKVEIVHEPRRIIIQLGLMNIYLPMLYIKDI